MSSELNVDQNPLAQGDGTEPSSGGESNQPNEGIQTRINELTAQRHAAERAQAEQAARAQALEQVMAQQQQQIQELLGAVARGVQPVQQAPDFSQADPEQARMMQHFLEPLKQQQTQMQREFQNAMAGLRAQQGVFQVQALAQNLPPEVQQRAAQLLQGWAQNPAMAAIAKPQDAVNFALGEYYSANPKAAAAVLAQQERGQFSNPGGQGIMAQSAPVNAPVQQGGGRKSLPTNFDQLPEDQQIAILEARAGNQPL